MFRFWSRDRGGRLGDVVGCDGVCPVLRSPVKGGTNQDPELIVKKRVEGSLAFDCQLLWSWAGSGWGYR